MKFELGRIQLLLDSLGNPQNSFSSLHIAGTNGKGSTAFMIQNALGKAGYRVGLYTSPHLVSLLERYRLNGQKISLQEFSVLTNKLRKTLRSITGTDRKLTQFEFLTAIAFLYFAQKKVDVAVIETGLGGRWDATNILSRVNLAIITNIGFDHTQWLGKKLTDIAFEKAGIIKFGIPVVTGAEEPALKVIRRLALQNRAALHVVPPPKKKEFNLKLKGQHQQHNAKIAEKSLEILSHNFPKLKTRSFVRAIESAWNPGRFESHWMRHEARRLRVILDGAHNPPAIKTLLNTLKEERIKTFHLLFGVLKDKDYKTMIALLSPYVERAVVVPVPSDRGAHPSIVASCIEWKGKAEASLNFSKGWARVLSLSEKDPILVTGSITLLGEVFKTLRLKT